MGQLFIEEDTSLYLPEDTGNSSESSGAEDQRTVGAQRTKLNEFLSACNVGSTVGVYKKNGKTLVCALEEVAYQKLKNQL